MTNLQPIVPGHRPASASVAVLALAALILLLYFGRVFFITLVIASIIAFLLDPVVVLFGRLRLPRSVSSLIVCLTGLLFVYLVGLALYTEISGLSEDLPLYSLRLNALVDSIGGKVENAESRVMTLVVPRRFQPAQTAPATPDTRLRRKRPGAAELAAPPPIQEVHIHSDPKPLWSYLYAYIASFYDVLLMASFVPFLVYFMLSWRDHLRRSFLVLFSGSNRPVATHAWEGVATMARAYVIGNFLLGFMLSVISCAFFFSIRVPYWPIVGPLSGFLSLVPYVGLPLAMIPPIIAGLATFDQPAMYILIAVVVAVLHLLAMNLLYPKVVGARVHLNPLAVTIALMFWGTLWGGIGLLLAIPITAGIKAVCDNVDGLEGYAKLLGD